jgi:hypothetical protein
MLGVSRVAVLLVVLAVLWCPAGAGASVLSPEGSAPGLVAVAPAPSGGSALVAWATGDRLGYGTGLAVRDRRADGSFGPVQTPAVGGAVWSVAPALLPSGEAVMLVASGPGPGPGSERLLLLRRAAGGGTWTSREVIAPADGQGTFIVAWAAGPAGDLAALVRAPGGLRLVRVPAGGEPSVLALRAADPVGGLALGPRGALRLVTSEGLRVIARRGSMTGPLGAPQTLGRGRLPEVGVAIDRRGRAAVAFSGQTGRNGFGVLAAQAPAGGPFGRVRVLDAGPNAGAPQVAAGAERLAIAWLDLTERDGTRVVLARPRGGFTAPMNPAAPLVRLRGEAGRYAAGAGFPRLAAGRDGTILLASPYGHFQAVHAELLRPGTTRFERPLLVAPAARGGAPTAAVLADGTPLVLTAGLGLDASARRSGPALDLTPPALEAGPLAPGDLRAGSVRTVIRCPSGCTYQAIARLTAGGGRDLVISRQARRVATLAPGASATVSFSLTDAGRAKLAATGRARAIVLVTASSPAGVSRTARRQVRIGR